MRPEAGVLLGLVGDQTLQSVLLEEYGRLHRAVAVEAEGAHQPAVAPLAARTDDDVLGQPVILFGLREREIGVGQEILVERHAVVAVLVAGDRGDLPPVGGVAYRQAVVERRAAVAAGVVVGDAPRRGRGIGVASLPKHPEREGVVDAPPLVGAELKSHPCPARTLPVAGASRVFVGEKAVAVHEPRRQRDTRAGRGAVVGRGAQPQRVARSILRTQPRPLVGERREGVDVHHAAHGVAAVERALRAAQHLDAFDVRQVEVVVVLREVGDVVHVEAHDRLVDACTQAAHVDRRGHARTVVGDVEIGNELRELLDGGDAAPLDRLASHDRGRDGAVAQRKSLFDRRHLHVVHHYGRVDRLRCFVVRAHGATRLGVCA